MKTLLTSLLLLLLVLLLLRPGSSFPSDRLAPEPGASWDQVNVVAHGLLQLGQGLKEHVDKTKGQMRDIYAKLRALNATLAREAPAGQAEPQGAVRGPEGTDRLRAELEQLREENRAADSRMDRLEEKVNQTGVLNLQMLNRRLNEVVEKIQQQQTKLEKQSVRLQELQSKVLHKRVKSHRRRDEETVLRGGEAAPGPDAADLASDCHDLFVRGQRVSGIYTIKPSNASAFNVFCQMTSDAGWTVIQRRQDGSQNFNQLWESYKSGFGNLNGEFWLGLENIRSISRQRPCLLQVALSDASGGRQAALYRFQLDGEEEKFAARLQPEAQKKEEEEEEEEALPFSTADRDNDQAPDTNCAQLLSGGWWFGGCGQSNLNGKYPRGPSESRRHRRQEMFWKGSSSPLKTSVLMIAPVNHKGLGLTHTLH